MKKAKKIERERQRDRETETETERETNEEGRTLKGMQKKAKTRRLSNILI